MATAFRRRGDPGIGGGSGLRRAGATWAAAAAAVVAGCGTPSADLFVVTRSGTIPGARLTLLVSDDGTVRCNGGSPRGIGSDLLLDARRLVRDLDASARAGTALRPGRGAVLAYRVRLEAGAVRFSDTSRGLTGPMRRVQAFTRRVATGACGLPR